MNSYITLDTKKYRTPSNAWIPNIVKPSTIRVTSSGVLDATYGPSELYEWEGKIEASVTPDSGYGSPSDLRTSLKKRQGLSFTDHYGSTFTVHVQRFVEVSVSPMWDAGSNVVNFEVRMIGK